MKKKNLSFAIIIVVCVVAFGYIMLNPTPVKANSPAQEGATGPLMQSNLNNWKCGCTEPTSCGSIC